MSFPADVDDLIDDLPTTPVAGVTAGHAAHSGIYKQIFTILRNAAVAALSAATAAADGLVAHAVDETAVHGIPNTALLVDSPNATVLHMEMLTSAEFAALGGVYTPLTFYGLVD